MDNNWKKFYQDFKNRESYYKDMKKHIISSEALSDVPKKDYTIFLLDDTEHFVDGVLASGFTKTQLRNLFETIKVADSNNSLDLLRPKLVYTAGRLTNSNAKTFLMNIVQLIKSLKNIDDYKKILKYIETVLAYHKYYANN